MKKVTWQFLSDELNEYCRKLAKEYREGTELFTEDSYHDNLRVLLSDYFMSFLKKVGTELDIEFIEDTIMHFLNDELKEFCKDFAEKYHKGWGLFEKSDEGYKYNLYALWSNFVTGFLRGKLFIEVDITFPPE